MKCDNELLEKITDDFANRLKHIELKDNNDGKTFTATIYGNAYRLATWAAGVADKCEVVEPQEVRDLVIDIIRNNKYGV